MRLRGEGAGVEAAGRPRANRGRRSSVPNRGRPSPQAGTGREVLTERGLRGRDRLESFLDCGAGSCPAPPRVDRDRGRKAWGGPSGSWRDAGEGGDRLDRPVPTLPLAPQGVSAALHRALHGGDSCSQYARSAHPTPTASSSPACGAAEAEAAFECREASLRLAIPSRAMLSSRIIDGEKGPGERRTGRTAGAASQNVRSGQCVRSADHAVRRLILRHGRPVRRFRLRRCRLRRQRLRRLHIGEDRPPQYLGTPGSTCARPGVDAPVQIREAGHARRPPAIGRHDHQRADAVVAVDHDGHTRTADAISSNRAQESASWGHAGPRRTRGRGSRDNRGSWSSRTSRSTSDSPASRRLLNSGGWMDSTVMASSSWRVSRGGDGIKHPRNRGEKKERTENASQS